jgi:hypothetical protein
MALLVAGPPSTFTPYYCPVASSNLPAAVSSAGLDANLDDSHFREFVMCSKARCPG